MRTPRATSPRTNGTRDDLSDTDTSAVRMGMSCRRSAHVGRARASAPAARERALEELVCARVEPLERVDVDAVRDDPALGVLDRDEPHAVVRGEHRDRAIARLDLEDALLAGRRGPRDVEVLVRRLRGGRLQTGGRVAAA